MIAMTVPKKIPPKVDPIFDSDLGDEIEGLTLLEITITSIAPQEDGVKAMKKSPWLTVFLKDRTHKMLILLLVGEMIMVFPFHWLLSRVSLVDDHHQIVEFPRVKRVIPAKDNEAIMSSALFSSSRVSQ